MTGKPAATSPWAALQRLVSAYGQAEWELGQRDAAYTAGSGEQPKAAHACQVARGKVAVALQQLLVALRPCAAAPQLLDSLLAIEWGGVGFTDDADEFDCCPNCFGAKGAGFHYAHCELRDSLDAALGVGSHRIVHPAHAAREVGRG